MTYDQVVVVAQRHGWEEMDRQEKIGLISFRKVFGGSPARVNVYITRMTVGTAINHPKKGKTQLFRRRVDPKLLEAIFENPRVHTSDGYQKRRGRR